MPSKSRSSSMPGALPALPREERRPQESGGAHVGADMTSPRRLILSVLAALLALPGVAAAENRHSDSMSFVKNLPYDVREDYGQSISYGTDVQFGVVKGKRYAFAGSELNGLQIV